MPIHLALDHVSSSAALPPAEGDERLVVVGVRSDSIAEDAAGVDPDLLRVQGFEAEVGQTVVASMPDGLRLLAGLGPADPRDFRKVGAAIAKAGSAHPHLVVEVLLRLPQDQRLHGATNLAEGLALGTYAFDRYKERSAKCRLTRATVVSPGGQKVASGVEMGAKNAEVVGIVRDLVNTPGGDLTPESFAQTAVELVSAEPELHIEVLGRDEITEMGLGGILGVNRGSHVEPRLLKVHHPAETARSRGHVALVGKGITFDSGGLSIKSASGMESMKTDMAGAAAVLGTMLLVPWVAPRMEVTAWIPLTDNMLGPDATRVGDVLRLRNGKTVEVLNTDAEGRLILGDALALAAEESPDAIVDVATLTGACMVALGDRTAGVMSNNDELADRVLRAGVAGGERLWRLPMPDHLRSNLDSEIADLRNVGTGSYGGALTAAIFLQEFVGDVPWAHIDIAGPASSSTAYEDVNKGGTGFGVRTLVHLLVNWSRLGG
jgi:leucyl aminopeptidase